MSALRADWTAYARAQGLVRDAAPLDLTPSKYHAVPVTVDGVRFASTTEAARYLELRLLEKTGAIADLERQPVFPLHVLELWRPGAIVITTIGRYTADFRYLDCATGEIVVEDVKCEATKTTAYRLRVRLAECIHGMTVREVGCGRAPRSRRR